MALLILSLGLVLIPPTTSLGQDSTPPPTGTWQTYDDTDPRLLYESGEWETFTVSQAAGGTLTGTASPGATLTVCFWGTGIRVLYSKGPEGGVFKSWLDGYWLQQADNAADSYSYGHVLAFEDLDPSTSLEGLPPGQHRLVIATVEDALWIEAIQVQGTLLDPSKSEAVKPKATPTPGHTPTPARESLQSQPITPSEARLLQTTAIPVANVTELINAVASSNSNCGVHTIIEMAEGTYSLTAPTDTVFYGNNGLKVNCTLTINGNGSTITRNSGTVFRIIGVGPGATLTLNDVTLSNGQATDVGGSGVVSVQGTVYINRSRIISNTVAVTNGFQILGGGVYSYEGNLIIEESEISGNSNNSTVGDGGGIGVIAGTASIMRSDIRNNSTTRDGGGVAMLFMSTATAILNDSDIVGNNRISVFANWGANAKKNWWGSSQGPSVGTYRTASQDMVGTNREVVVPDSVSSTVQYFPFKILVVSAFPGVTQEALDMHAVAGENGLYLHHGPTLNGKRQPENIIAWEDKVSALARLEFLQENQPSQVWYQIETSEEETGWIVARMEDKFYIDEVTADTDPCDGKIPSGSDLTFIYDRQAASDFAVLQSTENNVSAPAPYKVSRRIENLPYAHFVYDALSAGTGSAIFVSEAIWMGGLPMTVGNPDSCNLQPGPADVGWRYCHRADPLRGLTSPPWDFHESLGEYFTDAPFPPWSTNPNNNNTIDDKGEQVMLPVPPFSENDRITALDFSGILNISGGGDITFDQNEISRRIRDGLGLVNDEVRLQAGDYLWIDSLPHHGLVIVGWGLTQTCSSALTAPGALFANYVLAKDAPDTVIPEQDGVAQAVPYVADFVGYYPNMQQSPIPRPFYCTRYQEPGKPNFSAHAWYFYTLPDAITLSPVELFVDQTWSWTSSD